MGAPRPMAWYSDSSRRASPIEEGERVKQHDAEGVVHRLTREGTLTAWPDVRVKPAEQCQRGPRASTRPRRPVDAKSPIKKAECFPQPAQVLSRGGGRGFGSQAVAPRPWARCPAYEGAGRGQAIGARSEVNRTPKEIAPFRPISDGRTPEKQTPAHLAARVTPARAKRTPPARAKRTMPARR